MLLSVHHAIHLTGSGVMSNRAVGGLALFAALALFALYTTWAIVLVSTSSLLEGATVQKLTQSVAVAQPLLPDDLAIHAYVPDRRWAVTAPSLVLAVGLGTVGIYIGALLRKDALQDLQAIREKGD